MGADLAIIVPSRGRPQAVAELIEAFQQTCTGNTRLIVSLDSDDPEAKNYPIGVTRVVAGNSNMVQALNRAVRMLIGPHWGPFAVGFMGDDHRPRTEGWDTRYIETLREMGTGIVYGNDLLQKARLPTQVAMTTDIVRALGFMAPERLNHLFVDNYWRDLGQESECLTYLPDVVIEHLHPVAGKAEWDTGYLRVNSNTVQRSDRNAYAAYKHGGQLRKDAELVRLLRQGGGAL